MSTLHYELIDKYKEYKIVSTSTSTLHKKKYYIFDMVADSNVVMSGTHIVIGSYDTQKNIMTWGDLSNSLDRAMVNDIRKIRSILEKKLDGNYYADKDMNVLTTNEMMKFLTDVSDIIGKDIVISVSGSQNPHNVQGKSTNGKKGSIYHIHVITSIFSDNRYI
jgi:hypothetical protein